MNYFFQCVITFFTVIIIASFGCTATQAENSKESKGEENYQLYGPGFDEANNEKVRIMVKQLIEKTMDILDAEKAGNAQSLSKQLEFSNVMVGRLALDGLRNLGLPDRQAQRLLASQNSNNIDEFEQCVTKIAEWSKKHDEETGATKEPNKTNAFEAIKALCSIWSTHIVLLGGSENDAFGFMRFLMELYPYSHTKENKAFVLDQFIMLVDNDQFHGLIHVEGQITSEQMADNDFPKALNWIKGHTKYLFFHPEERTLQLDKDAEKAKMPSADYRKEHPWGKEEGPNKSNPKKKLIM